MCKHEEITCKLPLFWLVKITKILPKALLPFRGILGLNFRTQAQGAISSILPFTAVRPVVAAGRKKAPTQTNLNLKM